MAKSYEAKIFEILRAREGGKTMCPSEVLSQPDKQNARKMENVRKVARRLVAEGKIEIVQRGKVIDPNKIHGPIRLRLKL
jgi:Protein of unknown function (DUF3253)